VTEVYDPARLQASLQKLVEAHKRDTTRPGTELRTAQETVDGRTYYLIAIGPSNPLLEAHYTFAGGYMIAGPTRALVEHALKVKVSGAGIVRSEKFMAMTPRDHYANFSALFYQNLGTTLAPLAGLLGAFGGNPGRQSGLQNLGNMKPVFVAAYGEPDRLTFATNGNVLGMSLSALMSGNVLSMAGLPVGK
jgi:hypothetical protein